MRRNTVTGCVLVLLAVGCRVEGRLEIHTPFWDTRVEGLIEREEGGDATEEEGDVLLPGVRVPAPVEERGMQETHPDETHEEDVRVDDEAERKGTRVDARGEEATRVWRSNETARRELISWAKRLSQEWAWFATMTFSRQTKSTLTAVRRWRSWLSAFPKGQQPFRSVLWSAEGHNTGAVHIHALLASTGRPSQEHCGSCRAVWSRAAPEWWHLKESWYYHHGIARFYPFDATRGFGAVGYVTKYILSDDMLDWDFWECGKDFSWQKRKYAMSF